MSRATGRRTMVAAVFALALVPRLWPTAQFLTWDEPTWTYRSLKFARALETGRLAETLQSAHPGVITMWAGATAIHLHRTLAGPPFDAWRAPGAAPGEAAMHADLRWVDALPAFDEDDLPLLRAVLPWLDPARAAIAVLTAGLVALAAALAARLFEPRAAGLAGVLLALDPYLLAHSRVLHLDAVLALLVLSSGLAAVIAHRRNADDAPRSAMRWLAASGALGGLAFVEKSPGILTAGFAALVLAVAAVPAIRAGRWATAARAVAGGLAVWLAAAAAAYVAAWPALWVAPLATLARMGGYAAAAASGSREAVFFAGHVQPDPGPAFYVAAIALRLTPATTLGLLLGAGLAWSHARRGRPDAALLLALSAVVVVAMGASGKKFERYALPAVPPLDIVAALGLAAVVARLRGGTERVDGAHGRRRASGPPWLWPMGARVRSWVAGLALLALVSVHALPLADHPHELATYNGLLGGARTARRVLPIGWGEGTELAVDWLNDQPNAADLTVSTPSVTLIGPRFAGSTIGARRWEEADLVVLYVDDVQIGEPRAIVEAFRDRQPIHRVDLDGVPFVWIYRVPD